MKFQIVHIFMYIKINKKKTKQDILKLISDISNLYIKFEDCGFINIFSFFVCSNLALKYKRTYRRHSKGPVSSLPYTLSVASYANSSIFFARIPSLSANKAKIVHLYRYLQMNETVKMLSHLGKKNDNIYSKKCSATLVRLKTIYLGHPTARPERGDFR